MADNKSPAGGSADTEATSSGVEALIERLRQQGVAAGRAARDEFIGEAEREGETIIKDAASALLVRVRNMAVPAEFEMAVDLEASRPELERGIIRELLERDARYRPAAEEWTRVALDVKQMALEESAPEAIIDYLRRARSDLIAGREEE